MPTRSMHIVVIASPMMIYSKSSKKYACSTGTMSPNPTVVIVIKLKKPSVTGGKQRKKERKGKRPEVKSRKEIPLFPGSQENGADSDVADKNSQDERHGNGDEIFQSKLLQFQTHFQLLLFVVERQYLRRDVRGVVGPSAPHRLAQSLLELHVVAVHPHYVLRQKLADVGDRDQDQRHSEQA